MSTVTRIPRVLLKVSAAPERASFQYNGKAISVRIRPLFQSIRAGETKGRRTASHWFLMSSDGPWAEVNSWDLSHYLLQHSFRTSGLGTVQFAEPDLDQQWITGTPQQHALA